ncbi:uncharacterized protein LOC105682979 [Athalia rosae]|uniref:uncharacterized protein LOC105682979 n=1 Tax=Athalia rosae TaxID=37344 RepID=UPI0020344A1D|nr:uncharacterized protein LOC105682979 [Athalia rosae]
MGRLDWRILLCVALTASHFQDAAQIVIKHQSVPPLVQSGQTDYIILDCDYDLNNTSTNGLVVKWFLNENDLVYQWIYGSPPQSTSPVDKYIDSTYEASQDPTAMYRAMKLNKPGWDLTGEYTCKVSTFVDEATATKQMIVYSTEDKFELIHRKKSVNGADGVEVTCVAEGLFPRPTLDVSVEGISWEQKPEVTQSEDNRYAVTTRMELKDKDVPDPAVVICILGIPEANYNVSRQAVYYPGNGASSISGDLIVLLVGIVAGVGTLF